MTHYSIAIASDHAGVDLKSILISFLEEAGESVLDLGTSDAQSVDYPDYANLLAETLRDGKASRGVLICGSGIGMSIAANRHGHIRAALCHSGLEARLSRQHNDANILVLGSRIIGEASAKECVREFIHTAYEGGRHANRIDKLASGS